MVIIYNFNKTNHSLQGGAIWLAGFTMLLAVPRATAASVFINAPTRIGTDATAVAGMEVRASTTNWDQSMDARDAPLREISSRPRSGTPSRAGAATLASRLSTGQDRDLSFASLRPADQTPF